MRQAAIDLQEAKTRNKKEQGAIEAGEKLARELGLNMNLTAVEADEIIIDPRSAPSPDASPRKEVVGTHSRHSTVSKSIPSPSPSPSENTSVTEASQSPFKDISSHAVLDLTADAGSILSSGSQ